jgi:hypothetical protein
MRHYLLTIVVVIVSCAGIIGVMLWLWMLYTLSYAARHQTNYKPLRDSPADACVSLVIWPKSN